MYKTIEEYNVHLVQKYDTEFNVIDYFSKVHHVFFQEVDITFMNYFLDLSNPSKMNDFCIYEKDLRKYGLINERIRPRDLITKYNLLKQVEWIYHGAHEEESHHNFFYLGIYIQNDSKKNIVLTPKAFKKIILQSSNITFLEYYMLIETVLRYYHDYQVKYSSQQKKKYTIEMEEKQKECLQYEKHIEAYEEYIQKIIRNVNETMEACKTEINTIVKYNEEKKKMDVE